MATNLNPILTGRGRVFINENGAGCGNVYSFHNCMKIDSLEKSLGDITSVFCPDEDSYDEFVEVAAIKGTDSRWTSTLSGRMTVDTESVLERILRRGCNFNLQVHYGTCTRPDDFNNFNTSFIFKDVRLTSYSLDTLVALSPDERNAVTESAAISVGDVYRIFTPTISQVAQGALTTGNGAGIAICDIRSCGTDCNPTSSGCQKIYVLNVPSVTGPVEIVHSLDGGITWDTVLTNSVSALGGSEDIADIVCVGDTLMFTVWDGSDSFLYTVFADNVVSGGGAINVSEVFTTSQDIRALDLGVETIFGVGGDGASYIIGVNKDSLATTVFDTAIVSPATSLFSVDALDDNNVLVGGGSGILGYSTTFGAFQAAPAVVLNSVTLTDSIRDVHMINPKSWLINIGSRILCSTDLGVSWRQVAAVSGPGKFAFFDDTFGYFQDDATIWRTMDSGNTWTQVSTFNAVNVSGLLVCENDANILYGTGGTNVTPGSDYVIKGVA